MGWFGWKCGKGPAPQGQGKPAVRLPSGVCEHGYRHGHAINRNFGRGAYRGDWCGPAPELPKT